jgi:hypothetical protein
VRAVGVGACGSVEKIIAFCLHTSMQGRVCSRSGGDARGRVEVSARFKTSERSLNWNWRPFFGHLL